MKVPLNDYRRINQINAIAGRRDSPRQPLVTIQAAKKKELPAAEKFTHAEVHYEQKSMHGKQKCSACVHFIPPDDCQSVAKPIAPAGWCRRFKKRGNEQ